MPLLYLYHIRGVDIYQNFDMNSSVLSENVVQATVCLQGTN